MAGWCTSVRTVTHPKVYGVRQRMVVVERAPTPDDINPAHHWGHLQAPPHGSAGPCGTVASQKDADGWPWRQFIHQVQFYVAHWGFDPLMGGRVRASFTKNGRPRSYDPACVQDSSA